ncbi:hypothetical protein QJS04_geneDACA020129 [Acorus gramineus]|uniref:Uncharacterized protein n=1 Tax=Acorus gramineus TaxID=55184 RepID=A0AAV9BLQ9_ACOGR|nr:hypothetical protein QJS04_geneDACA020129 [Acorus gramineus]
MAGNCEQHPRQDGLSEFPSLQGRPTVGRTLREIDGQDHLLHSRAAELDGPVSVRSPDAIACLDEPNQTLWTQIQPLRPIHLGIRNPQREHAWA